MPRGIFSSTLADRCHMADPGPYRDEFHEYIESLVMDLLHHTAVSHVRKIREEIQQGQMDGSRGFSTFYGILIRVHDYPLPEDTQLEDLHLPCQHLNIPYHKAVTEFCKPIKAGETPLVSHELALLDHWCGLILDRPGLRPTVIQSLTEEDEDLALGV